MSFEDFLKIKKEIRKIRKESFIYTRNSAFQTFCVYLKVSPQLRELLLKSVRKTQKDIKEKNIDKILVQYRQDSGKFSYDFVSTTETINFPMLNTPYLNKLVKKLSY